MNPFTCFLGAAVIFPLGIVPKVVSLDQNNIETYLNGEQPLLVKFATSWCGYCKDLQPKYEKAAELLKKEAVQCVLGEVDCDKQKELCAKYGIQGYPTLKFWNKGREHQPSLERTTEGIVSWMKKAVQPSMVELAEESAVAEFASTNPVAVVASLPKDEKGVLSLFKQFAEEMQLQLAFGVIFKEGAPRITLYRNVDKEIVFLDKEITYESLSGFVQVHRLPYVDEITANNYLSYFESKVPLGYIFYSTPIEKESLAELVRAQIKGYKDKVHFVTIDSKMYGDHAPTVNLEKKWPALAIHDLQKDRKYCLQEVSPEKISKFLTEFLQGKLEPMFKSAPAPLKNDGSVKEVVRSTIKELVLDETRDVLLMVAADWCSNCKALQPVFEELGGMAKNHNNKVTIARIEMTQNDLGGIIDTPKIEGFPTLLLFKGGDNHVFEYTGQREVKLLAEFIAEKGLHKVNISLPYEKGEL